MCSEDAIAQSMPGVDPRRPSITFVFSFSLILRKPTFWRRFLGRKCYFRIGNTNLVAEEKLQPWRPGTKLFLDQVLSVHAVQIQLFYNINSKNKKHKKVKDLFSLCFQRLAAVISPTIDV